MKTITRGLLAFAVAACLEVPAYSQTLDREYNLEIERQPLSAALTELSKQTGLQIGYFPETLTDSIYIGPISGRYTAEAAITQLLLLSGLSFERLNERTIAVTGPESTKRQRREFSTTERKVDDRIEHSFLRLASVRLAEGLAADEEGQPIRTAANARESDKRLRGNLEEIIVTAQKRAEDIKDVPMSITAISGEQIQSSRIFNTLDLSFAVPGLAVAETGPGRQVIVIRGLGSERGSSSLTGVYVDEIPVSGAQDGYIQSYIDVRTIDLERVEVLKGPQGTLFGEGSVGGTVRWITKDPVLQGFGGQITTSFYSTEDGGGSEEVVGIANLPLVENVLGIRAAATYENKSGWIDQPSIGRTDINDNEVYNVRIKGLWQPTPELKVKGMAIVHRNEGGGSNIVNQDPHEDSNFLQGFDRTAPSDFSDEYELYNLTATYDFGFAELLSSTSRTDVDSAQGNTQLTGNLPVPEFEQVLFTYDQHAIITAQELRLTSSGDGPLNWTIGGFYKEAEITQDFPLGVGIVALNGTLRALLPNAPATARSKSLAEYADLAYAVTSRLKIGGGLRYFVDEREAFNPDDLPGTFLEGDFNDLSFRAYASFAVTEGSSVYVTVGDGARSGGFNAPAFIAQGGPPTFDPESVISYEVGIKTLLFDGRVSFDAALFYSEYEDMQENSLIVVGDQIFGYTSNDQAAEIKGGEWDLAWKATDHLTLRFAGDVTDTEITKRAGASPYDVGDPIDFVPEYRLIATADYQFDWASSVPGFLRIDFNRQGQSTDTLRRLAPFIASPYNVAPEVSFLNVSLGAEFNNWEMTVFGRNLTDERGIIRAGNSGLTAQARPRTVGVTIAKKF